MAKKKPAKRSSKRWSARVTRESNALDLERDVFTRSPRAVAQSLKRSATRSRRRKSSAYRSAMSMLTFYINRAGKSLSRADKDRLEKAKDELRSAFGREQQAASSDRRSGRSEDKPRRNAAAR